MGSVISLHHLQRIDKMVKRAKNAGSKILAGGERLFGQSEIDDFSFSKGAFYPPTVITDVTIEDEIWKEEVFGPVVVVKRFSVSVLDLKIFTTKQTFFSQRTQDEAEGISLANSCKYGLGAGIWTMDLSRAHRVAAEIQAGLCWVNTHHRNDPSSPWCETIFSTFHSRAKGGFFLS